MVQFQGPTPCNNEPNKSLSRASSLHHQLPEEPYDAFSFRGTPRNDLQSGYEIDPAIDCSQENGHNYFLPCVYSSSLGLLVLSNKVPWVTLVTSVSGTQEALHSSAQSLGTPPRAKQTSPGQPGAAGGPWETARTQVGEGPAGTRRTSQLVPAQPARLQTRERNQWRSWSDSTFSGAW